jgi:ribosome-binding factor A
MSKPRRRASNSGTHKYPRSARLNEILREVIADELTKIDEHRRRIQSAIGAQVRAKKTPILEFRPDEVIRAAERIDEVIRETGYRGHDAS